MEAKRGILGIDYSFELCYNSNQGSKTYRKQTTMKTFTLNGKTYQTDTETLNVLRSIIPSAKTTGDSSAVIAVIELGKMTRRIIEVK